MNKDENEQFIESKPHIHAPDARRVGRAETIDTLKRKAAETTEPPRKLISIATNDVDRATLAEIPSYNALRRTVSRVRHDKNLPTLPTNLNDLVLPEEITKFKGEIFLMHDSGPGDERFLIFCTQQNLEFLMRSDVLLMDGTFDIVPPLFTQLYTIQGIFVVIYHSFVHIINLKINYTY